MKNFELILYALGGYYVLKIVNEWGVFKLDEEDQTGTILDAMPDASDVYNMATEENMSDAQKDKNTAAFLALVRYAEGTMGGEGYRALFGWRQGNGKTFSNFADHPRQYFNYTNLAGKTIRTSAAGAYQITATTYDALNRKYGLSGFTPDMQDKMAVTLIQDVGALSDVQAGRVETAIRKCRKIWASLPNSGVDQPTRNLDELVRVYSRNGGVLV